MAETDLSHNLAYEIDPGEFSWTISSSIPESAPRTVASPLSDRQFLGWLAEIREWSCRPVRRRDPQARGTEEYLRRLAEQVGNRLADALFPEGLGPRGVRLILRVKESGELGERVLALPWELMASEVVREAVAEGAPELPEPSGPLAVAALIAAPEDLPSASYEQEALRLQVTLAPLGHRVSFTDLGRVQDLVELVAAGEPHVLHFSGHGREGRLLFEDE